MAGVVLLSWSARPCESTHVHAWTLSEQAAASIIDDSRCGMSGVAFRTAHRLVGFLVSFTIRLLAPSQPNDVCRQTKSDAISWALCRFEVIEISSDLEPDIPPSAENVCRQPLVTSLRAIWVKFRLLKSNKWSQYNCTKPTCTVMTNRLRPLWLLLYTKHHDTH